MNNVPMTAKEYLSRAYRIDQRINAKLMRISELRALAQKCTVAYGGERVSHTRNVSSLEDSVMKIMEAEKELDAQIDLLRTMYKYRWAARTKRSQPALTKPCAGSCSRTCAP